MYIYIYTPAFAFRSEDIDIDLHMYRCIYGDVFSAGCVCMYIYMYTQHIATS